MLFVYSSITLRYLCKSEGVSFARVPYFLWKNMRREILVIEILGLWISCNNGLAKYWRILELCKQMCWKFVKQFLFKKNHRTSVWHNTGWDKQWQYCCTFSGFDQLFPTEGAVNLKEEYHFEVTNLEST